MTTWMSRAMYTKNMDAKMSSRYIHFVTHDESVYMVKLSAKQIYDLVKTLDMALKHNLSIKQKEWKGEYNHEMPLGHDCENSVDDFITKMANSGYMDNFIKFLDEIEGGRK